MVYGHSSGSCRCDICVFSFHPVKIITSGEGGIATTNNAELFTRMSDLRSHGITKDPSRFKQLPAGPWSYEQQSLGFNYRMTDFQAALGLSQLARLDIMVSERNKLRQKYESLISNLPVNLLNIPDDVYSSVHLAVILLEGMNAEQHIQVFEGLRSCDIGVQLHYSPVHLQPYYRDLGFEEGDFPVAEHYYISIILPLYPGLDQYDQERVVSVISQLLPA